MFNGKIFKKIALGVFIVMFFGILASGCGDAKSSFFTLQELYESGSLTRNDIMNIAALRNGSVLIVKDTTQPEWEFDNVEFNVTEPDSPLSDSDIKKIESQFAKYNDDKIYKCEVVNYYGTYSDNIIVEIKYKIRDADVLPVQRNVIVSDIYLGQINMTGEVVAWRKN